MVLKKNTEDKVKILEITQNTPDWYALRRSKIGASDAPSIIGKNPYKTPFMVWEEKVLGRETPINEFMQRGIDMEPEAREYISTCHKAKYETTCVEDDKKPWRIASLDGWDKLTKMHVEIKCPTIKRLREMQNGIIPEYWIVQVQHQLLVTEREEAYLLGYSPEHKVCTIVHRNEKLIAVIDALEEEFYENYLKLRNSPPLLEVDIERIQSEQAITHFMNYIR